MAFSSPGGGGGPSVTRDLKDNIVPKFDNTTNSYPEWRKRVQLYARKMQLQKRESETALNLLASLEGPSWTQCEDLDLGQLEKEDGIDILLRRLDSQWSFDARVEMPTAFENFFFRLRKRPTQTPLEYSTDFHQALREVAKHKIDLPEEVTGWLMLKRAQLSREQEQMVHTQIGTSLSLGAVQKALFLILGQDYRGAQPAGGQVRKGQPVRQWRCQMVHQAWDDDDDYGDYYEPDATYRRRISSSVGSCT